MTTATLLSESELTAELETAEREAAAQAAIINDAERVNDHPTAQKARREREAILERIAGLKGELLGAQPHRMEAERTERVGELSRLQQTEAKARARLETAQREHEQARQAVLNAQGDVRQLSEQINATRLALGHHEAAQRRAVMMERR
jgi:hypothetical protein